MKRLKAENVEIQSLSLCLLEEKINNDFYFWKIFNNNNGNDYNSFYVLDRNKKNIIVTKKHAKFNTQYRKTIQNISDLLEFKFEKEHLAREASKLYADTIIDCTDKNFILKKMLINRYELNKDNTYLTLYSSDNDMFLKVIFPYFWKFMSKKLVKYFIGKLYKKPIDISFYFFNEYYDKKFVSSLTDYSYEINDSKYFLISLIQAKYNYNKINLAKLLDFFRKSNTSDTNKILVLENILNNKKISEIDSGLFLNILIDNKVNIINNPHFKKIINRNAS